MKNDTFCHHDTDSCKDFVAKMVKIYFNLERNFSANIFLALKTLVTSDILNFQYPRRRNYAYVHGIDVDTFGPFYETSVHLCHTRHEIDPLSITSYRLRTSTFISNKNTRGRESYFWCLHSVKIMNLFIKVGEDKKIIVYTIIHEPISSYMSWSGDNELTLTA